jgi:hypothetical protein
LHAPENGFGHKQDLFSRVYPAVLDVKTGPLTKAALMALLEKHGPRPEPQPRAGAR